MKMLTYRSLLAALCLAVTLSSSVMAQGRSPLLDKIVRSVRHADPQWHFVAGVCDCPALVQAQTSYAFGGWHHGKLTSTRHLSIYISYVPTAKNAADWIIDLARRNAVTGWHRELYPLADDAYLWVLDNRYAYLYFRRGATVVELSGALDDVKFLSSVVLK